MPNTDVTLFPFQEDAVDAMRTAALAWVDKVGREGSLKYGKRSIPFLGQLRAVTGSGKTPILASVLNGLGDAVVIWTSKSSAVVEQTFNNLRGKYSKLLPKHTSVIREMPSQAAWRQLMDAEKGLTIWLLTTASWNEVESAEGIGTADARLNLHRPHLDWAGDSSPWDQLRNGLQRPLWVISDESHNQTGVQLHQLAALRPVGFFMASATPVINELFEEWQKAIDREEDWSRAAAAGVVRVRTRDVVEASLLKTTLELLDFNSGAEESLDGALAALNEIDAVVDSEGASLTPRAIYVVEQSNPRRGSRDEARPVAIWRHLRARGVPANEIAIYTDTRDVPKGAEQVSALNRLQPRHRHIIFNQSLQEGWDDPEAYVCYFDGVTKSFLRIRQIVGRILRQPFANRFASERLNTATLVLNSPSDGYQTVVDELRAELRLYAPEDEPSQIPIKLKTRKDPLEPVPVKKKCTPLSLPRVALKAPDMTPMIRKIESRGKSPWSPEFLEAQGVGRRSLVLLASEDRERTESFDVLRSARTENGDYLRRRIANRNRDCLHAIHPDRLAGSAFGQQSCQGSDCQADLDSLATEIVEYFEARVEYQPDPDPDRAVWHIGEHRPRSRDMVEFDRAAHAEYAKAEFRKDELMFAQALDADGRGVWARNPPIPNLGFCIPLPTKVGESRNFFPDFLWWVGDTCWAIDPTGRHLLEEKVRGKLVALETPRVALLARGKISLTTHSQESPDGWTVVISRPGLQPLVEHADEIGRALEYLVPRTGAAPRKKTQRRNSTRGKPRGRGVRRREA